MLLLGATLTLYNIKFDCNMIMNFEKLRPRMEVVKPTSSRASYQTKISTGYFSNIITLVLVPT
jgi:hypothetical protein